MEILHDCYSEQQAYFIHDYPADGHLRTICRYFIQSKAFNDRDGHSRTRFRCVSSTATRAFSVEYSKVIFNYGIREARKMMPSEGQWSKRRQTQYSDFLILYVENEKVALASINIEEPPQRWEMFKERFFEDMNASQRAAFMLACSYSKERDPKIWEDFEKMIRETESE